MAEMQSSIQVVVIGAGVIGLSTAVKIQERGYSTTLISEQFMEDTNHPERSEKYTSYWAGAVQTGFPDEGSLEHKLTEDTFRTMWDLSSSESEAEHCFLRLPLEWHVVETLSDEEALKVYGKPWHTDCKATRNPSGKGTIVEVNSLTIEPEPYLPYLMARFRKAGGRTLRAKVQHIHQLLGGKAPELSFEELGTQSDSEPKTKIPKADAIIVCTGLGARTLGGVEDDAVIPVRGQTVWVKAPWIKKARMKDEEDGGDTYVLPRRSGTVVLGGIYTPNDWYARPRPEITESILQRTLKLCPELVPISSTGTNPDSTDPKDELRKLIIGEACGLRPGRVGGIRLEVDLVSASDEADNEPGEERQKKVPVVYNYGHTGLGYSMSWGSASRALELLEEALGRD
ncbi:hypothetical protein D9758_007661 [Tetrapyrgos nigripes]|uniref:FAD dependent oxidoreductase domain-containing protein n=1 Tax=Tetrapyrgos nigripes TaxID=182062 RepID=A0A8H5G5B6_9AGAR|nr:hypothetical protein D9758_007661 [Tetrapyrgos nigripes]